MNIVIMFYAIKVGGVGVGVITGADKN